MAQEFKDTPVEDQIYKFCKRIEKTVTPLMNGF